MVSAPPLLSPALITRPSPDPGFSSRTDNQLNEIAALAADICEVPFAVVSLKHELLRDLKFKAGMEMGETLPHLESAFHACTWDEALVIRDALADERFAAHPLVLGQPGIRFLAGMPLATGTGGVLGALYVMDVVPRDLNALQLRTLRALARQASSLVDLKKQAVELKQAKKSLQRTRAEKERSEKALRRSELEQRKLAEMLSAAQEAGKVGSWVVDANTLEAEWSGETHRIFGIAPGTVSPSFHSFFERVHPDDKEEGGKVFQQSIASNQPQLHIHRMIMPGGEVRWLEHRWQAFPDEEGSPYKVLGVTLDVTERVLNEARLKRLNRLYAIASGINAAIVRITDTQRLFEEACRIAVEEGGLVMSWGAVKEQDRQTLRPLAASGKDQGYVRMMNISPEAGPMDMGPSGRAFRTNQTACSNDIAADPCTAPWREQALERGYRSCACCPLRCGAEVMGGYAV